MSDDSTNPPEHTTPEGQVPDAVVPPPPAFDGEKADAVIPPPPAFDGPLTGAVPPVTSARPVDDIVPPPPVFEGSMGEAVIPPPPTFDGPVTGGAAPASDSLRRRTPSVAGPASQPDVTPGTLPAAGDSAGTVSTAPDLDPAFAAPPEVPSTGGYRAWTGAIFAILLLLLAGAIALVIYLATSTSLDWSTFGDDSADETSEPATTEGAAASDSASDDADAASAVALTAEPCSEFCVRVADQVSASVIGADGEMAWTLAAPWTTADAGSLPAEETTEAGYESDAGRLDFVVWRFADDAEAEAAFATLGDELGEPTSSDAVYADGTGTQSAYRDGTSMTLIWTVPADDQAPWVMQVQGPDDDAVRQFYLALPF